MLQHHQESRLALGIFHRIRFQFPVKIFAHKRLDGLLEAFVHGLACGLLHAGDVVQVRCVLDREHLPVVFGPIKRERILHAIGKLEFLPAHPLLDGVGMHGAVAKPFPVRIEEGTIVFK